MHHQQKVLSRVFSALCVLLKRSAISPAFLASCALILIYSTSSLAAELPVVDVERQPLVENLRRIQAALDLLGQPIEADIFDSIRQLDSLEIQRVMDQHVGLGVRIQTDALETIPGSALAKLQQAGYTALLVKIINERNSQSALHISSPQSGPVYAGVADFSLKRQQQEDLSSSKVVEGSMDRFLDVDMFTSEPLRAPLSGLTVEYAVALIYSSRAGKQQANIAFHVDDVQSAAELTFDVQPAIPVRLSVRDEDNSPTLARLTIRDAAGHVYPPQPKRLAPDLFFQPHIYRADGEVVHLPPGEFIVESCRGPEYQIVRQTLRVPRNGQGELDIKLARWIAPDDFGFFSGDHHIHAAGCAHYTHPTEGIMPEDMFRQVKGEGLNVGCVLTWGPCFDFQRQFFTSNVHTVSEPRTLLKYDLEISGFGSQSLGHVCLLDLKDQTYPGSDGTSTKGWPTWTTPVMRWAKQQGAVTGYAHSASGIHIDAQSASKRLLAKGDADQDGQLNMNESQSMLLPFGFSAIDRNSDEQLSQNELVAAHESAATQLPNLAIPEMNGVGAMEISVTTSEGVCDFISAMDTARIQEWNTWYHLLNCGFPLKVSGETDFPCMSGSRVGQGRVYVHLGEVDEVRYSDWCQGIAQGRSYVSDGFAHAVEFSVNEIRPGYGELRLNEPERVTVRAMVAFSPETPETVAQGLITPSDGQHVVGDTVELHVKRSADKLVRGGERTVELIVNGKVEQSTTVAANGLLHELVWEIPLEKSSWVAIRQFPQLHTNPVNVIIGDQPIRASRSSALWCIETIELLWKNREQQIAAHERAEAKATFERAVAKFREIAEEQ